MRRIARLYTLIYILWFLILLVHDMHMITHIYSIKGQAWGKKGEKRQYIDEYLTCHVPMCKNIVSKSYISFSPYAMHGTFNGIWLSFLIYDNNRSVACMHVFWLKSNYMYGHISLLFLFYSMDYRIYCVTRMMS
jgi:hypothetical protein